MYIFDTDNIHGDMFTRILDVMRAIKAYAVAFNKNVKINRFYIDGFMLKVNFSVNGDMYLISYENEVVLSKRNPKNQQTERLVVILDNLKNEDFSKYFKK